MIDVMTNSTTVTYPKLDEHWLYYLDQELRRLHFLLKEDTLTTTAEAWARDRIEVLENQLIDIAKAYVITEGRQ